MSPPHFPIPPRGLRGTCTFGTVAPGPLKAEGFTIEARKIPHKGGATFGYRVSDGSHVIAYLPDHCPTALGPGPEGGGEYHRDALDLASDVDLLLHDAFLLPEEVAAEASFGHAAADYAIGLGQRAGGRRVMLTHHKPGRTDEALDQLASRGPPWRRLQDRRADLTRIPSRRLLGGPPAGRRLAALHRHRPGGARGPAADPEVGLRPATGRRPGSGRPRIGRRDGRRTRARRARLPAAARAPGA